MPRQMAHSPAQSLWADTAPAAYEADRLEGPFGCDVAIVGAGFTGLRAALALAEAGTRVAVFEAGAVGHGASGRSGGQVNPLLPVARPGDLRRAVGPVHFERLARASLGSADALFTLVRDYQIDCQARQCGWLRADHSPKARQSARAAAKAWIPFGLEAEEVEGDTVTDLSGSPLYRSGLVLPRGGAVQPLALVRGLARAATQAGAKIYESTRVTGLSRGAGGWTVTLGKTQVTADSVILATNGYSDGLLPGLRTTLLSLSPIQMATGPLPQALLDEILPQGHTIADTRRCIIYARREPGGQLVFGGIGRRDRHGRYRGFAALEREAYRVFPQLRGQPWQRRWGGQIAVTQDRIPHFYEPQTGLFAGLGYNGRGVALSLVMGAELAKRALGAPAEDLVFPRTEMSAMPFHGLQSRGAAMALAWMRFRDGLELARGR
ncbi:MAG: FAD-dependent oxidoreductase [Pseudomonadota bacterium]